MPGTLHGGFEATIEVLRNPKPALLGAVVYWAFDIATLWACFRAFGAAPPIAVVVVAYYVGSWRMRCRSRAASAVWRAA